MTRIRKSRGSYKCLDCGCANDSNNAESDYCSSCQSERRAAWEEAEWDRRREDELMKRDGYV